MITALLAGVLAFGMPQQQTDTTFAVRAGARLELEVHAGSAVVRTWDRDAMRIRATHAGTGVVRIRNSGATVQVEAAARGNVMTQKVDYEITVPRSFGIEIEGINVAVTIDGLSGDVDIENVEGAIRITGVTGAVAVESVSGSITLGNVRGSVRASTTNQSIHLRDVSGSVSAEAVNGSIVMRGIDATVVEAHTVNGLVEYHGTVKEGGRYALGTHNGQLTMALPERTNATLRLSTFNGRVQADFPVQVGAMREGVTQVTLGSGSARVDLESFNGTIYLVRPAGR